MARPIRSIERSPSFRVVLVTAGSLAEARRLARFALRNRLAACVSLLPRIESWYWWRGKVTRSREVLLLIKTHTAQLEALYRCLKSHHSYEVPEFLALPVDRGARSYLRWLEESLQLY